MSLVNVSPNYNQIFIERKEADDGEIEVSTYVPTQIAGDIDFTKLVLPPNISFQNGTLSIKTGKQQTLDFKRFNANFTMDQFKLVNMGFNNGLSPNFGLKVVFIRFPKNLQIEKGINNVQMISNN